MLGEILCVFYKIKHGKNVLISPPFKYHLKSKRCVLGDKVSISSSAVLLGVTDNAKIIIGDNIRIAHHFQISCANKVEIKSNVNIGPFVFITDHNHKFENPNIPIKDQGLYMVENTSAIIGEDTWIGAKVTIIGNVHVGKHCVIGANSVVTKDIPDYCVAVGSPAKVIKKYNFESCKWEKVN